MKSDIFNQIKTGLKDSISFSKGDISLKTSDLTANQIKLLLVDVDGTLTNAGYNVFSDGSMSKQFNTRDFHGLSILHRKGVDIAFVTGANTGIEERQISRSAPYAKCFCAVRDKLLFVKAYYLEHETNSIRYKWSEIAYIGDDTNDIPLLREVGIAACPADAEETVIKTIKERDDSYVMSSRGGDRCVREFANLLLSINGYNLEDEDFLSS